MVVPQTMQNDPSRWEKGGTSVDRWETSLSVKSCEAQHCDYAERTGRQVGDKCEILRAESPEYSGRQLWERSGRQVRNHTNQREHSALGDKWRQVETSGREM